jgi:hypothetical protein
MAAEAVLARVWWGKERLRLRLHRPPVCRPHCSNAGLSAKPPAARRAVEVSEGEARLRGRRGRGDVVGPSSPVRRRAAVVCLFPPPPDVSREKELRDWGWRRMGKVVGGGWD